MTEQTPRSQTESKPAQAPPAAGPAASPAADPAAAATRVASCSNPTCAQRGINVDVPAEGPATCSYCGAEITSPETT